jgi:hypothetical protein
VDSGKKEKGAQPRPLRASYREAVVKWIRWKKRLPGRSAQSRRPRRLQGADSGVVGVVARHRGDGGGGEGRGGETVGGEVVGGGVVPGVPRGSSTPTYPDRAASPSADRGVSGGPRISLPISSLAGIFRPTPR